MKKRILGLALALVMIISLLPMTTLAATVSKTVTLWGTAVTVDNDDATTDIKDAYYWVNNGTELPKEKTTEADWNYSFAIIDGVATLTLKGADYKHAKTFLSIANTYEGKLDIVYKGENTIATTSVTAIEAKANNTKNPVVSFIGGDADVLNISGNTADGWVVNLAFGNHNSDAGQKVNFIGGTINITRTTTGKYGAMQVTGANILIDNCNLNVTSKKTSSYICWPAVIFVPESNSRPRTVVIKDSDVTIDTTAIMGLLVGSYSANSNSFGSKFLDLNIQGNSNVSVTVASSNGTAARPRAGIVANNIVMTGKNLEVKATTTVDGATASAILLKGDGVTAPDLTGYVGQYNMYVAEDGEPVNAYAASTYFKVAFKPCTTHVGVITDCTKDALCTNPGCTEKFYTAPANAAHVAGQDDGDCTTGIKCQNCDQIAVAGAASHKDTRTDCGVAGTCANPGCQHAFAAGQHNPAADDGDCTTDIKCATCGKVATKGQAEHKYTDKNDTTCNNAGCTKTRTVDGTENPKTGDNTALVLVATLMVAAAAAFVCTKKFAR